MNAVTIDLLFNYCLPNPKQKRQDKVYLKREYCSICLPAKLID